MEKTLQSWTPRSPSDRIANRLFPSPQPRVRALSLPHHAAVWNWLTPVGACLLAMLVILSNGNARSIRALETNNASYFAVVMHNEASSSNVPLQTFAMSKTDVNLEWNVWPFVTSRSAGPSPTPSHLGTWPAVWTNKLD